MSRLAGYLVPLVLLRLAALLIWVAVWRIWLPPASGSGAVARTVTTVDADAPTRPTHKVTTVVKASMPAVPSRRSEPLALAVLFLGAGAAVIGVFHDRIGSMQLGKDGVKIDLTEPEAAGASALVGRLASQAAPPVTYARGLDRYLRALASRRRILGAARSGGLTEAQARELADRIADGLV
jgi:hypothetical protein